MRVIAGEFKGRRLTAPKDAQVRPTQDRVKEAIFSMLAPQLEDAVAVDLFAGSGSLGIEALSRGARLAYFCDVNPESLRLVRRNIETVGAQARAVLLACDWRQAPARIDPQKSGPVTIVLVDAPYDLCEYYSDIITLPTMRPILADGARIVIERSAQRQAGDYRHSVDAPFEMIKEKRYGSTAVDVWVYDAARGGVSR